MKQQHPFPEAELQNTVEYVLQLAKRQGASAAEALIMQEKGYSVTARSGEVETLEHHQEKSLLVTVYYGKRSGSASTTNLSKIALEQTIKKAEAFAHHAGEDPCSGLADPCYLTQQVPDLSLYHHWDLTPSQAIDKAIECEHVAREQDLRIIESDGVGVSTNDAFRVYGNSHGFLGSYPTSYHYMGCGLVAKDQGEMQRDYEYSAARDWQDLEDPVLIGKHAAEKTVMRLNARKLKTQKCPVIFHAAVAKGLLKTFVQSISGGNLYRKMSFLLDHLGKQIFPEYINIYQEPHLLKAVGSAPFDSEGVKTQHRDYVKDGELMSYVMGSYSARQLGMETTGNAGGVFNLFVSHSDHNLKRMFEEMERGFFVTELIGEGVNMVTGAYSRGAVGFWVEDGAIQHAVHEVTIAGNLKDMFHHVVAVGNDVDHRGSIHTGSIWIREMMLAGE